MLPAVRKRDVIMAGTADVGAKTDILGAPTEKNYVVGSAQRSSYRRPRLALCPHLNSYPNFLPQRVCACIDSQAAKRHLFFFRDPPAPEILFSPSTSSV